MQAYERLVSRSVRVIQPNSAQDRIRSNNEKAWLAAAATCFVIGSILGIGGLVMSVLTVFGTLGRTQPRSLWATAMIVLSLGSLALGAHAMDRMDLAARHDAETAGKDKR